MWNLVSNIYSCVNRAFGDWTRRQSAAVDTHRIPQAIDPRISERQHLLERVLQTTRWPTKQNVAADVDPLGNVHHFIPIQLPAPALIQERQVRQDISPGVESKQEVFIKT